jgi:hypothetical protein
MSDIVDKISGEAKEEHVRAQEKADEKAREVAHLEAETH